MYESLSSIFFQIKNPSTHDESSSPNVHSDNFVVSIVANDQTTFAGNLTDDQILLKSIPITHKEHPFFNKGTAPDHQLSRKDKYDVLS